MCIDMDNVRFLKKPNITTQFMDIGIFKYANVLKTKHENLVRDFSFSFHRKLTVY